MDCVNKEKLQEIIINTGADQRFETTIVKK